MEEIQVFMQWLMLNMSKIQDFIQQFMPTIPIS